MSKEEWFKTWFNSFFYYQLYFQRDEIEAKKFITNLTRFLELPLGSKILDVACGRGRHSKILYELGYNVSGIDIAEESIAYANQQAAEGLQFYVHDMRLPFWINYFDCACNLFTSFGYFKTQREDDAAMRTIAHSLKKGGKLVIDYLNVHRSAKSLVSEEEKIINGTIYKINRRQDEKKFYKEITVVHPSLEVPQTFTEIVSKFTIEDFEKMLDKQHLTIQNVFGDYELNAFDKENSPRLILIASKN